LNSDFSKLIVEWYHHNLRDLPWRNTQNPYHIWLSEIILQQTRVIQGLPYYNNFIKHFPTVEDLAKSEEEEVLKLWQGLGYYSRARNLHKAAQMVMNNFSGKFPKTYNELIKLKGVGAYTASAVASFANNEAVAVVDGNVYRVLSRYLGVFTPINSTEGIKEFKKLADSLLDIQNPANHNQAIMEFGALCCTPKKPNCLFCPLRNECYSFQKNTIEQLPVKLKKTKISKKHFSYLIVKIPNNKTVIHKRIEKGIWQHLYEFPLVVSENKISIQKTKEAFEQLLNIKIDDKNLILLHELEKPHKLSHQHIYAQFFECYLDEKIKETDFIEISIADFDKFPIPVLISNFIKTNKINTNKNVQNSIQESLIVN